MSKYRIILFLLSICVLSATVVFIVRTNIDPGEKFAKLQFWMNSCDKVYQENKHVSVDQMNQLVKLSKQIARAHRYSRSTIAMYELNQAFQTVRSMLDASYAETIEKTLQFDTHSTGTVDNSTSPPEVCPELYMGMMHGYPYYYRGHITNTFNCTSQPINDILSVALNVVDDISFDDLNAVLLGLSRNYSKMNVHIGYIAKDKDKMDLIKQKFATNLTIASHEFPTTVASGLTWKTLSGEVKTKYLFVGKNLVHFDNHTSFERLLRFLSYINADVVGGAHRFVDGRWFRGCFQSGMRNYTLKLVDGYDLSYNSCIYCDYASGPFMTRRQFFIDNIDEKFTDDMVFVDFFTRIRSTEKLVSTLVCPDVMFVVNEKSALFDNSNKARWIPFTQKWYLNRVIMPNKNSFSFSCAESNLKCTRRGGMIMPICCLQELADMAKFYVTMCEKHGIPTEMEAGSGVGIAKMYGVIPYERDADFDFLSSQHEKLRSLIPEFKKNGYQLEPTETNYAKCLNDGNVNCGYFALRSANWRIELWGANYLGSDEAFNVGLKNRTRALFDGVWTTVLHSPAESARNQYGDDLFEHVEHWSTLGHSTGWVQPPTGHYLPCPTHGFHGCLDMFLPIGNIQFQDIWI